MQRVEWSRDGSKIVTAAHDKLAIVWDVTKREKIAVLAGHLKEVETASFNPDGTRVVTASCDGIATIWDITSPE